MEFGQDIVWESSIKLVDDIGMYLEDRDCRKRRMDGKKVKEEEREQRRMPPKKMATLDMGGSGNSSSSSNMSPAWQVNDLDIDLPGELSMNEALLSLPSLAVFKQEAPSPPGGNSLSPPRRQWARRSDERQLTNMPVDGVDRDAMECDQPNNNMTLIPQHCVQENIQCAPLMSQNTMMQSNGYHSPINNLDNKSNQGLLVCSNSFDGFLSPIQRQEQDDTRFQYVLAAATSIATKTNEDTLTYLNQGQPYEIKLKKLGDLSHYKGKILKSVIKICFHERRLQYIEREQMARWHNDRPGERIVEVDVPLSYGVIKVQHPTCLNALHVYWDPFKDVGVYIKVNCISTEFTAKKHGGEKGVPFRIQIETYMANDDDVRLHAAACQIKVFKLKGADRKHKQDREKVMRRSRSDLDKYQPGCEATVLTTLPNDAILSSPPLMASPPYSPEMCVTPRGSSSPTMMNKPIMSQAAIMPSPNQMKQPYGQDDIKVNSPQSHSPGTILPDMPQAAQHDDNDKFQGLSKDASAQDTQSWLNNQRFAQHANTFSNFSGADLLRLSRDDIIQICGLADGIRLFNALHAKRIEPRLTLYVCPSGGSIYSALYLHNCKAQELLHKLKAIFCSGQGKEINTVLVSGPNGARVRLTDDLVKHLPDNSTYSVDCVEDALLLCST